ncbi:MAG TPA: HNH endonuclease [Candidatus Saccharimonadales bacterium]|nr:HNH endonuclease [Candidatus Saccharimonadales bacterium]
MTQELPDEFIEFAQKVTSKRPRTIIELLLKKGVITTGDIERAGYLHPPRAIRDVRESGIPIITSYTKNGNGKRIAEYRFGDPSKVDKNKLGGRQTFPKSFKAELYSKQEGRCAICDEPYESIYLQIDHRVPYEFMADDKVLDISNFMLLCASCNRKKDRATITECSKTCFKTNDLNIIRSCYWASPENYTHICMKPIRHSEITWSGEETKVYDQLKKEASQNDVSLEHYIKRYLTRATQETDK